MNTEGRTIARNAASLMAAQLLTWVLALALTIVQPRYLGVRAIGQLQLALSLWAMVGVVVAFGMDMLLAKEIARAPQRLGVLLGTSLALRSLYFLGGCGLMAVYVLLAGYAPDTVAVILVVGLAQLFGGYGGALRAALQGLERMEFISLADVLSKLAGTVISIALLLSGHGVLVIAGVVVGMALFSCLIQFYSLRRVRPVALKVDWPQARWMVRASLPYFLSSVFLIVYAEISMVTMSLLTDETGVGWYGTAYRLLGPLLFIPTVFMTAAFPALARQAVADTGLAVKLLRRSFALLLIAAVPLGLGIVTIAQPLVLLLYGPAFVNSGPVLAVLGITLIFLYLNVLIGQYLVSIDRQNQWTLVMGVATVIRILLDLLLIPLASAWFQNGALGAAVVLTVTEVGMLVTGLLLLPRGTLGRESVGLAGRTLLAGAGMLLAVLPLRAHFIGLPVAVGALVYLGLVLVLRVVSAEDWRMFASLGQAVVARLRRRTPKPSQVG